MGSEMGSSRRALTLSGEINPSIAHVDAAAGAAVLERRAKPRISQAFPTRVLGLDSDGRPFDCNIELENISSGGVYLRIPRTLKIDDQMNLVVQFSNGRQGATASMIASVLRVEPGLDGLNGFGLKIKRYEFI